MSNLIILGEPPAQTVFEILENGTVRIWGGKELRPKLLRSIPGELAGEIDGEPVSILVEIP